MKLQRPITPAEAGLWLVLLVLFSTLAICATTEVAAAQPSGLPGPCPQRTGNSAVVVLDGTVRAEPGDVVTAETPGGGACYGRQTLDGNGSVLTVWADDPYTPERDGFEEHEPLALAFYRGGEPVRRLDVGWTYRSDALYLAAPADSVDALVREIEAEVERVVAEALAAAARADAAEARVAGLLESLDVLTLREAAARAEADAAVRERAAAVAQADSLRAEVVELRSQQDDAEEAGRGLLDWLRGLFR